MPSGPKKPAFRINKKEYREQQKHPYSLEELVSFYRACYNTYLQILHQKPDIIVAPLRGSEPIIKTVRLIASLERKSSLMPTIVFPRTGEQHRVSGEVSHQTPVSKLGQDMAGGMSLAQKKKELLGLVGDIIEQKRAGRTAKIFLIDEAFSGGSITQHYTLLQEIIRQNRWRARVYAIAVTTNHEKVGKSVEYLHLLNEGKIKEYSVPWLFTTDSSLFLQPLLEKKRRGILKYLKRKIDRPALGLSHTAIEGRAMLLHDIQEIHQKHVTEKTTHTQITLGGKQKVGIARLPIRKTR